MQMHTNETNRDLDPPTDAPWVLLERVGERAQRELNIPAADAERALLAPLSAGRLALRELIKPTGPGYGFGSGAWGRGVWGGSRGRVSRGLSPTEVAALSFETGPLRALRCVADRSREPSWVPVGNPIEIAWFDARSCLVTAQQSKPSRAQTARRSYRYDDTAALEYMHELLSTGRVRSIREAARTAVRERTNDLRAASPDAHMDRLRHRYPDWRRGRDELG
jgi:hypothetical protein